MTPAKPLSVSKHERGVIRIFQVDLEDAELRRLQAPKADDPSKGAAIAHLLGLNWLDEAYIELFDVSDLDDLGLAGYLEQGNGVARADIDKDALEKVEGWVLVFYSRAFEGKAAELRPNRQLNLLGIWQEEREEISFAPLTSQSASGTAAHAPVRTANPHLNVLWAILALPVLVLIIGAVIFGVTR